MSDELKKKQQLAKSPSQTFYTFGSKPISVVQTSSYFDKKKHSQNPTINTKHSNENEGPLLPILDTRNNEHHES